MLLTVFMLLSSFAVMFTVQTLAADADGEETETTTSTEEETTEGTDEEIVIEKKKDYVTEIYATPEEKLATMRLAVEKQGYQIYVDDYSGEVACVNLTTGDKLFTNPYDVGASTGNETTKHEILSQIIVKFTDNQGMDKTFTSYEQAVLRNQVVTEPIKNGLRVEYTIGREQTKSLVPRLISVDRFNELILAAAYEAFGDELYSDDPSDEVFRVQKIFTYFVLYSKDTLNTTKAERENMDNLFGGIYDGLINSDRQLTNILRDYPVVDSMPVYVFDPEASEAEVALVEEFILTYCPEYTYEELEYDHTLTQYESEEENPPVFRMALEYKLDEDGLTVRLPANGIRFNESLYTLSSIDVLPYMGAGHSGYNGYNFFPDGSGTVFEFQDLNTGTTRSIVGQVYGTDFAYHEITGTYQKAIRYPVFGIVENTKFYTYTNTDIETGEVVSENTIAGSMVEAVKAYEAGEATTVHSGKAGTLATKYSEIINKDGAVETVSEDNHGFLAIIEEGDALASLSTYHAGALSDYNTIKMSFTPRPKDSYRLSDSVSVGAASNWTVVSSRKYVGGYKMRYVMLSDYESEDVYDASWLGMAVAYRDYLTEQGVISKLTDDEIKEDIPLYIETFGAVETTEKVLSIPVTVTAPLTTFEDVYQMYTDLSAEGINNINFKLTGYANGGMYSSVPGKLKFEKAVGGNDGFQWLLDEAARINAEDENNKFGVFPDFNFAYSLFDGFFDGYRNSKHAAKTIDDRYASRREYSATQQKYENFFELAVSPAYFSVFYEKLEKKYADKYDNVIGISVGTLGSALNSDFDEDEPYNREDSKDFTVRAFKYFDETYNEVMTEGGNAYVWQYVDHMLDVALDSSRYNFSSYAVPFIGVVLHGSVSFAGEPLNMEGDLQYALLKAIENGASPYFILSYQQNNISALKEYFDLSRYYSIRYDIWKNDIPGVYNTLNDTLHDVQNKYIIGHEFLVGERVPDSDELENDILKEYLEDLEAEQNIADIIAKEIALTASVARQKGREAEEYAADAILEAFTLYASQKNYEKSAISFGEGYYEEAYKAYKAYEEARLSGNVAALNKAQKVLTLVTDFGMDYDEAVAAYDYVAGKLAEVEEFSSLSSARTQVVNAYSTYSKSKTPEDRERAIKILNEKLEAYGADAQNYLVYRATKDAHDFAINSGFNLDFDEAYDICIKYWQADFYSNFLNLATAENALAEDVERFEEYVAAKLAYDALKDSVSDFKVSKGSLENYLGAVARVDAMTDLGYGEATDEETVKLYNNATAQMASVRANAINGIARIDGYNVRQLKAILEAAEEHLAIATEAINTLAIAEGVTVEYTEGSEKTIFDISNYDEIAEESVVVKLAIDRARATYDYIYNDRYIAISDGNVSGLTLNGQQLLYTRSADGDKVYFYGTVENGYSYFALQTNEETGEEEFVVYHMGEVTNKKTESGEELYSFRDSVGTHYYTATLEGGYTYYEEDTIYKKWVEKDLVVREGNEVDKLVDGTVIYLEGDVYYSVNADGTYTRYNYYRSIEESLELCVAIADDIKALAFAMVTSETAGDFAGDVQKRIERNNASIEKVEEEEVVEETVSRYSTENIVAVTYGDGNDPYKTIILNYNNYTVKVVYDFTDDGIDNGVEYTIPAYEFVVIER